jgi:hypothetical protein
MAYEAVNERYILCLAWLAVPRAFAVLAFAAQLARLAVSAFR